MELYGGRPESIEDRLPREVRTYDFLDAIGIGYKRTDHEPANNMEESQASLMSQWTSCCSADARRIHPSGQ